MSEMWMHLSYDIKITYESEFKNMTNFWVCHSKKLIATSDIASGKNWKKFWMRMIE